MGDAQGAPRARGLATTVAKLAAGWVVWWLLRYSDPVNDALDRAQSWLDLLLTGNASRNVYTWFDATWDHSWSVVAWSLLATLVAGGVAAGVGMAARIVARARVRAGQGDFLERARAWTAAHPGRTRALLATPGALWLAWLLTPAHAGEIAPWLHQWTAAPGTILAGWGMYRVAKNGLAALLAPTMAAGPARSSVQITDDEIVFDAVAVTRETLAAVAGLAAISVALVAYLATRTSHDLFYSNLLGPMVGAYVAAATAAAVAFRRASRVAVGVDGVHVHGTSRARFFAYRDVDDARVAGSDVELVRRGRVVLRLQLHGEDAVRREAVVGRIRANIARAREGRGAAAAQIVASSSKEALARFAEGAGDYRMASLTREQLWALVEGPEIEAQARKAAAEALVRSDDSERARLRVAAERCAEPQVRVALEAIAGDEDGAEDERRARPGSRSSA
jgi:hypothetical protein